MIVSEAELTETLQSPSALKQIAPYLSDEFDPLSLDRPGFVSDLGLEPAQGRLLLAGALGQTWLPTVLFYRALADEIRAEKLELASILEQFQAQDPKRQGLIGQHVASRMDSLIGNEKKRSQILSELRIDPQQFSEYRKSWNQAKESRHDFLRLIGLAVQLRLLGLGFPLNPLKPAVEAQYTWVFLWFFRFARPVISEVSASASEGSLEAQSPLDPSRVYIVRESLLAEVKENSVLNAALWGRQWVDYFANHRQLTDAEFNYFLDHLQDQNRYKWPDMVPTKGGRPKRAVAAVAGALLEAIAGAQDTEALARLFKLVENFSEHHDMKAVLTRRFGI